ncbi:MAG: hypothetical protein ACYC27_03395 [Armatimonadota bacterium]
MKRLLLVFSVVSISLLCASPLLANYSPYPDRASISMLPSILLLDFSADAFFVLVSLIILGQIGKFRLDMLLSTFMLVMIAGFIADAIGIEFVSFITHPPYRILYIQAICISIIGLANYCIGRYFLELDTRQSIIMGVIIGIFTMPIGKMINNVLVSGYQKGYLQESYLHYHSEEAVMTYVITGTIFAVIGIILLYIIKPISRLSRRVISVIGLLVVAGFSYYSLKPAIKILHENEQISLCSLNMKHLALSLREYEAENGDFPPDLGSIPLRYLRGSRTLRCEFDTDKVSFTSYEYRKPPRYILHPEVLNIISCPVHTGMKDNDECQMHRRSMIDYIADYKREHGGVLPSELGQHGRNTCPDKSPDGGPTYYIYRKPPADFNSANSYWILRCTHHPDYDIYASVDAMASTLALPKNERYK